MGAVHDLLLLRGEAAARAQADGDRRAVEAAIRFMSDDDLETAFVFSGWAQAALPHKRLPDNAPWQLRTDHMTLLVEPGRRVVPSGPPVDVGVPYGSRARLILIYLQTEALRTGKREVELGGSLREWLGRMGIAAGGKSIKDVREQAERLARCRISFHVIRGNHVGLVNQNIVEDTLFLSEHSGHGQGSLFAETATLSDAFYKQLQRHPVPVQEAAIRAISNNSMALDLYVWLAYRLHSLSAPKPISWRALHAQLGASFARIDNFRQTFKENLNLALAVYPEATVDVEAEGLVLRPSRPPVAPRLIQGSKLPR